MSEPVSSATFWIAVASADHVARGVAGGFMQVCHGKPGPLRRIRPGDGVVYYSPTETFGGRARCSAFTAIGTAADREPYVFDMGNEFRPWRRDVAWRPAQPAPIAPLLDRLAFSRGRRNWGAPLRFGLFTIDGADFTVIADAMGRLQAAGDA